MKRLPFSVNVTTQGGTDSHLMNPCLPATLAQASRLRRDIVTGEAMDEALLLRFVEDPNGAVVPDLSRNLPGRGFWVAADRASIDTAARRGLFARAAKKKLAVSAGLSDQVAGMISQRLLSSLGFARKSGEALTGFEKVNAAVLAGRAAFLIEAVDGALDGRRKMLDSIRRSLTPPRLIGLFTSQELGLALGGENVVHSAFLAGRGAQRWSMEVGRLAGFQPLFPAEWET